MQKQMRISRTNEFDSVLSYFKSKYFLLSESDIIKMILSEAYYRDKAKNEEVKRQNARLALNQLSARGKKAGNSWIKKKGYNPNIVTEETFYEILETTESNL